MAEYQPTIGIGTIFKRSNGRYYYEYKTADIKATSLKTSDPYDAEKEARKRFGYLLAGNRADQLEEATARLSVETKTVKEATRATIAIADIWENYLRILKRTQVGRKLHADADADLPLASSTLECAKSILNTFCKWLAVNAPSVETMDQVSSHMTDQFFDMVREEKSLNTYNRYLANLRPIWKRLAVRGGMKDNPFDSIQPLSSAMVDTRKASKRPFTVEQLQLIMDQADKVGGWLPIAIRLGYETGLRLGDVCTIALADLDIEGGYLSKATRKGGKSQVFYIPESLPYIIEWIKDGNGDGKWLFPTYAKAYLGIGRKADRTLAGKQFMRFLRGPGIRDNKYDPNKGQIGGCEIDVTDDNGKTVLGFHSLRASNATYSRTVGASVEDVQQQLGHSNQQTTNGYIQEDAETIKARVKASYRPLPTATVGKLEIIKQGIEDLTAEEKAELLTWLLEEGKK